MVPKVPRRRIRFLEGKQSRFSIASWPWAGFSLLMFHGLGVLGQSGRRIGFAGPRAGNLLRAGAPLFTLGAGGMGHLCVP